ncbi:MAG TPA: hypothetical protein VL126_05305 [Bacteroidota bacterium]|nr:hypothetical protein [Bacteroidota bacterium]
MQALGGTRVRASTVSSQKVPSLIADKHLPGSTEFRPNLAPGVPELVLRGSSSRPVYAQQRARSKRRLQTSTSILSLESTPFVLHVP